MESSRVADQLDVEGIRGGGVRLLGMHSSVMPLSLTGNLRRGAGGVGAGLAGRSPVGIGPDVEEPAGQLAGYDRFIHPHVCAPQHCYKGQIAKSSKQWKEARVQQSWKHSCSNQGTFPGSSTD